jgi:hypothetical protein
MAPKQDKGGTEILDASAPRPDATPPAAPRVLSDAEQREVDEYQRQVAQQQEAAGAPRLDETQPGGKYAVNGRTVDAEGREV